MDARRPDRTVLEDPSLFLVEFSGGSPEGGSVEGMHAALRHAVARVAAAGMTIRWYGSWLVPTEQRCLCLIEAAEETCVVLARDTAALSAARVHPLRPLDRRTGTVHPLRPRGRS